MTSYRTYLAALALIMGLSTLGRPARAAMVIDNFDTDVVGTFPGGWSVTNKPGSSTLFATGGTGGIQAITASESLSAPQSLLLHADSSYNIVNRPFSRATTGLLSVEFAIRLDVEPHNASAAVYIDDRADALWPSDPMPYGLLFTGNWHGRQMSWFDGTWHDFGGYDINRWYSVKLLLDLDTEAFDIFIDGTLVLEGALPNQPLLVNGVQRLILFNDNGYSGSAWFDNISVSRVPEPATLSLLALGGLAMLRRRRRWTA